MAAATKRKSTTIEQPPTDREVFEDRVCAVRIELIDIDHRNDRDQETVRKEDLQALGESMELHGQQQPIGLIPKDDGRYRLVFGHRRLAAARLMCWDEIQASVMKATLSDEQVQEIRAVENFQRQDLNYVEEAFAVAGMVEAFEDAHTTEDQGKSLRDKAISHVATRVGKTEQWVRDRAFLSRASPKVREFCRDGSLPFPHAREIVKLTSHERQDEVAVLAHAGRARWQQGKPNPLEPPMPIDELRKLVGKSLFSLSQVPWRLEVPFAGQPSCERCPRNSVNQTGLFEHAAPNKGTGYVSTYKEPAVGICTDAVCFHKKELEHRKAVRAAAAAVLKEPEGKKAPPVPEYVKPSQVKEEVKDRAARTKERAAAAGKPKAEKPAYSTSYYDSPQYKALQQFKDATARWGRPAMEEMKRRCKGDPILGLSLSALSLQKITIACQDDIDYRNQVKSRAKVLTPNGCADIVGLAIPLNSLAQLERLLNGCTDSEVDTGGPQYDFFSSIGVFEAACTALGIELKGPRPSLDAVLEKLKAGDAKRGEPAGKGKSKGKKPKAAVEEVGDAD